MSIVSSYTRAEWEQQDGWKGVEAYVDGVMLLFREQDNAEDDVLPQTIRIDRATGRPWPEDVLTELPNVPWRYYRRREEGGGGGWELWEEGCDRSPHQKIIVSREQVLKATQEYFND
jgi:hypothetical protein